MPHDRGRALDILRRARDLLAERLTERILDAEEGLLDDARGDSYLGDIDTIYDQFGTRLSHLNQLINNLPLETEVPTASTESEYVGPTAVDAIVADEVINTHPAAITGPLIVAPPALPAPRTEGEAEFLFPSFQLFAAQIRSEDLLDAARTLSMLLDISETRGVQCVRVFRRRWESDEALLAKSLQLRGEVLAGSYNNALMLLAECFGLVGIEAIGVLQALRSRLAHLHD
jgi:hypothetical protein